MYTHTQPGHGDLVLCGAIDGVSCFYASGYYRVHYRVYGTNDILSCCSRISRINFQIDHWEWGETVLQAPLFQFAHLETSQVFTINLTEHKRAVVKDGCFKKRSFFFFSLGCYIKLKVQMSRYSK